MNDILNSSFESLEKEAKRCFFITTCLGLVGIAVSYFAGSNIGYKQGYEAAEAKYNQPAISTTEPARAEEGLIKVMGKK